jgi:hypothetical protein
VVYAPDLLYYHLTWITGFVVLAQIAAIVIVSVYYRRNKKKLTEFIAYHQEKKYLLS